MLSLPKVSALPKHPVLHSVPTVPGPLVIFYSFPWLDAEKLELISKKRVCCYRSCCSYLLDLLIPLRSVLFILCKNLMDSAGPAVITPIWILRTFQTGILFPTLLILLPVSMVITPFGLFKWMPFGLRNTRCMFQRMMDKILGGIPHCFVYNDDILIASPDAEYHQRHVQQVLTASGSTVSVLTMISMYLQLRK